jgi:hypothetical protein
MSKDLAEAQRQYQIALEHHRRDPDHESNFETLLAQRMDRDRAWLDHQVRGSDSCEATA